MKYSGHSLLSTKATCKPWSCTSSLIHVNYTVLYFSEFNCILCHSKLQLFTINLTHSPCTSTYTMHQALLNPHPSVYIQDKFLFPPKKQTQGIVDKMAPDVCRDSVKVLWCRSQLGFSGFGSYVPLPCFHLRKVSSQCNTYTAYMLTSSEWNYIYKHRPDKVWSLMK